MKKWTILLVTLLFLGMIFWSCSGEDDSGTEPVPDNIAPTCEITSPANNLIYTIGDTILVQVNATDEDGSIDEVRFYLDSLQIGLYTDSPYSHILTTNTLSLGLHTILVEAEDNEGLETTDEIIINLNNPPMCQISEPENNSIFEIGDIVSIVVDASDSNKFSKSIANVEFYIDNVLRYTDIDLPYSYEWNTASYSSGNHVIKVITEDNDGAETESQINTALDSNHSPVINSLLAEPNHIGISSTSIITCIATDYDGNALTYTWRKTVMAKTSGEERVKYPSKPLMFCQC
ncbi:MAG: Ig-like domain-containing protein [Candidatus Delongbacteria bacterium]|jgi:hypothetical protein|nr:Ig-like domain-containing protein [Candidatus Delongbacteria bacterium]